MSAQPSRDDFNLDASRSPAGAYPQAKKDQAQEGEEIALAVLHASIMNDQRLLDQINAVRARRGEGPAELPSQRKAAAADPVNKPAHYRSHPSGIECIQVTEHMGFNLGNAVKYIWRCDLKLDAIEDLKKAVWYINREISKREGAKQ
jgi:hypothetical protein